MAPFRLRHDELQHELPWRLMQNGPVTKYWRREYFEEDLAELIGREYWVPRFDCSKWHSEREMHDALRTGLRLPDHTSHNFDALSYSLTDAPVPDRSGLMLALDNFTDANRSDTLLDVLAGASRWWLLFGRILGALLRTDDATYDGGKVGATPLNWNVREQGDRGPWRCDKRAG